MNNNMQPIIKTTTKIPFFRRAVLQNFPFIEKDFDALTDYELLCKVVEYLNKVIEQTNLMEDNENELVRVYNELYNYVEHYFDNLDVQEEINNKLDEMASDGSLLQLLSDRVVPVYVDIYENLCENVIVGNETYKDWSNAFTQALSENRCICLKPHDYYISDTILIENETSIIGENKWLSKIILIPYSEITGEGIIENRSQHCVFRNFCVYGNDELNVDEKTGIYFNKLTGVSNNDNIIDSMVICHIKGNGIYITQNSYDNHIINTVVYRCNNGIVLNTTDNYIDNCIVRSVLRDGYVLYRGSNTISNSKAYFTGRINSNSVTENVGCGFIITDLDNDNSGSTNKINNCFAQECGYHGFSAHDVNNTEFSNCLSDSNGVYIETSDGFHLENCNYSTITGDVTNKAYLTGKQEKGIYITGIFNSVNIKVDTWTLYRNVLFKDLFYSNYSITNSIIINNQQYINPNYYNSLVIPRENNMNVPLDFTTANVSDPTGSYSIDYVEQCACIEITNGKTNGNKQLKYTTKAYSNCDKISICFDRKEDYSLFDGSNLFGRVVFYNENSEEISRVTHNQSDIYTADSSRWVWTKWYYDIDIPSNTATIEIILGLATGRLGATGKAMFKNLKILQYKS